MSGKDRTGMAVSLRLILISQETLKLSNLRRGMYLVEITFSWQKIEPNIEKFIIQLQTLSVLLEDY